jgi:pantoate--beta-alanine ligase
MKTIRTVAELRAALTGPRRAGQSIGLVPTMGALHEGHLSLIHAAREQCDQVVVSLFVNPAQFNESADLEEYPRDELRDARLAALAGADFLFAPSIDQVYPRGFASTVSVAGLTEPLEGASRGTRHFDGVTTVVTKLFNMVAPDVAYFGQKDAQQAAVIRRLVSDLDLPIRVELCPTVRESDGLALSSRNARLSAADRKRATALYRALQAAAQAIADGGRDPAAIASLARAQLTSTDGLELEYFELVDPTTFTPVRELEDVVLAVVAARIGVVGGARGTRLIDNQPIRVPTTTAEAGIAPIAAEAGSSDTQEALECSARC